ncbi:branched-chain amino acid transport system II carrier protein [Tenacibaculum tangerinum]|uniref:Branched-chain amino acid transport system II carrier protein n=1 Tax=Tenacibaculum tangerinum TaxID=3038772 RepID=A0ABY8KZT0_9FLAO|nr:branched-chain amino acid transport system II carrier protein [Tenacibaculum tangerinum]WGH74575.1 branched-chain amino acid transport system II carrier protein [Tenacibaculum tangerinum]
MHKTKEIFINGFALFSMFFGAGNLILPPFLGKNAGDLWFWVTIGFFITAVFIPMIGILAHAKLQGTMYDFGKKVSPAFSLIYCFVVYAICITLPAPRTASVTHEMAIAPYFQQSSSLLTSTIYFGLVFLFVINRSKVLTILGKFLTPLIIVILLAIIFVGISTAPEIVINSTTLQHPFVDGVLEGYQTFDAIASIVVGGVLVISMNFNSNSTFEEKKEVIIKAGIIAGLGLLIIYTGLIYIGFLFSATFGENATRTAILNSLSYQTLGNIGSVFLSVLVALACFTTAVGIITGTADYFKGACNNSQKIFIVTAVIGCLLGVAMGQLNVGHIINIALPALMFIYPITIVLILLNVFPVKYASPLVFKIVIGVTFLFSIPDFLGFFIHNTSLTDIKTHLPLADKNLGWVLPAAISFILANVIQKRKDRLTPLNDS